MQLIPHLLCSRKAREFPLLPAALASVPVGFVLVRVRVRSAEHGGGMKPDEDCQQANKTKAPRQRQKSVTSTEYTSTQQRQRLITSNKPTRPRYQDKDKEKSQWRAPSTHVYACTQQRQRLTMAIHVMHWYVVYIIQAYNNLFCFEWSPVLLRFHFCRVCMCMCI